VESREWRVESGKWRVESGFRDLIMEDRFDDLLLSTLHPRIKRR
jgi:hypothetical protein